jgi:histidinol-phosphate aminotransferase
MQIATELPAHVLLVLDEAYLDFLTEPCDLLPLIRSGRTPNLLLTRTFSKIHGLAGLRVGYGIGSPELVAALEKVREPFNLNSLAQVAALAALGDVEHLQRTRDNKIVGMRFYEDVFRRLELEFVPSSGNFVLVRVGNGLRVFTELQNQGVIVRPMGGYQLPDWIRISIGTPLENERCVESLREVLGR